MKNLQKIKRVLLKNDHAKSVAIYGIVSSDPDYKLTLSLNKKFNISLKSTFPVVIKSTGRNLIFSRFSDTKNSPDINFYLISNRADKDFLLKKLKNVDYIFHVEDPAAEENKDKISASLKEIESITAVFNIESLIGKDKNLDHLTH
jgi:hypothetical protein